MNNRQQTKLPEVRAMVACQLSRVRQPGRAVTILRNTLSPEKPDPRDQDDIVATEEDVTKRVVDEERKGAKPYLVLRSTSFLEKQLHKQCTETRDVLPDTACCVRTTLETERESE